MMIQAIEFVINGEPRSKANNRILLWKQKRIIKNKKAQDYMNNFILQGAIIRNKYKDTVQFPIESVTVLTAWLYYASHRPDLDESLVMDGLEKAGIIKNDRQIREKHIYWKLDKENPRAKILLQW